MTWQRPLHERPICDQWREWQTHWHAYSLPTRHTTADAREYRLRELPVDAVLFDPVQVAQWIELQHELYYPLSQPQARESRGRHELGVWQQYRHQTNMIVAASGQSVYVQIRDLAEPQRPATRDLWVEAVIEQRCAVRAHGDPPQWT